MPTSDTSSTTTTVNFFTTSASSLTDAFLEIGDPFVKPKAAPIKKGDKSWMKGLDPVVRDAIETNHDSPASTGTALGLTPGRMLYQDCADFYLLEELHRELFPFDGDHRWKDDIHFRPGLYDGRDNKLEWLSMDVNKTFKKFKETLSNELAIYLSLASGGEMRYVAYQLGQGVQRELHCDHKHGYRCCGQRTKRTMNSWDDVHGLAKYEENVSFINICQSKEMMQKFNPGTSLVGGVRMENECYLRHWSQSHLPKDWIEANRCDCTCPHDHKKGCRWAEHGPCGNGMLVDAFIKQVQNGDYMVDTNVFWLPLENLDNLHAHVPVACCTHDHKRSKCWVQGTDKRMEQLGEPIMDFLQLMEYLKVDAKGQRVLDKERTMRHQAWNRGAGWAHWSYIYSQAPGEAMDACADAFNIEEIWGQRTQVGGKKWGTCARLAADYYNNRITDQTFLDRCWTLQHNNGSIFNKYYGKMRSLMNVLQIQAMNDYRTLAHTHAHGYIGSLYRDHSIMTKKMTSTDWLTMPSILSKKTGLSKLFLSQLLDTINDHAGNGCIACKVGSFMKEPLDGGGTFDPCGSSDWTWSLASYCAYSDWYMSQMHHYFYPYTEQAKLCAPLWDDPDEDFSCIACYGKGDPCSWNRFDYEYPTINPECVYAPGNSQALTDWTGANTVMAPNEYWEEENYEPDSDDDYDPENY